MILRVLSYNIHKGFSLTNTQFILDGIKKAMKELDPDVVFLQEVLGDHQKNKIPDWETAIQFEYLADSVWTHFAYGKNAIYPEGHHGNAILSKFPIIDWENYKISTNRLEHRGLLKARIQDPISGKEVVLANTHLDLTQRGRDQQTQLLIHHMRFNDNAPWVLVGDFNDWNKKVTPRIERELGAIECFKKLHGKLPATFPSVFPVLQLDRVFVKGFTPIMAEALSGPQWRRLSDHLPLLVEIKLTDSE
ncbi:MAG TPA: endonuclease/exonuclease/phosphatase family protein [Bacteriovoracaceae bacterium]|nr:endonuclease/exonuclease/phosphatase family protein [Bacteriovoracaceae bacterium]